MEKNGRYQAIPADTTSALILDTQEGHLWLWGVSENDGIMLVYQGQVTPGEKMGDILDQFPGKREAEPK